MLHGCGRLTQTLSNTQASFPSSFLQPSSADKGFVPLPGKARLEHVDWLQVSPDCTLVAHCPLVGVSLSVICVSDIATFSLVVERPYSQGISDFKWACDSKSLVVLEGTNGYTNACEAVCISTREVVSRCELGGPAFLSAHGRYALVSETLLLAGGIEQGRLLVMDSASGNELLVFEEQEHQSDVFHPHDDDILSVMPHGSSDILLYSVSQAAVLSTHRIPLLDPRPKHFGGWPADAPMVTGHDASGQNSLFLVGTSTTVPLYTTNSQTGQIRPFDSGYQVSPDGKYMAASFKQNRRVHFQVRNVFTGNLCFSMAVGDLELWGYERAVWFPNSKHFVITGRKISEEGRFEMQMPALYAISTSTWQSSPALLSGQTAGKVRCLWDCCGLLVSQHKSKYSFVSFCD